MKKILCIIGILILSLNCTSFGHSSASSLKYEIRNKNNEIRNNEYKISKIKHSKKLSENEKKRKINRLK